MKNFLFIYKTKKNYIGYNLKDMSYYYLENIYLEKSENKICRLTIKNENFIYIEFKNFNKYQKEVEAHKGIIFIEFYDSIYLCESRDVKNIFQRKKESIDYFILEDIIDFKFYYDSYISKSNITEDIVKMLEDFHKTREIIKFDKISGKIYRVYLEKYPIKKENFSNIKIEKEKYILDGTRIRPLGDKIDLSKYVGDLKPVYFTESLFSYSNPYSVYKSYSCRSKIENEYSIHGGKGNTDFQAYSSSIGEAYERYSARFFEYDIEHIIYDSFNSLKYSSSCDVLNPELLCLDQNYINKYDGDKKYEWIKIKNLTNNKDTIVPANSVFFPYNREDNFMLHSQSTTGIASEQNISFAVLQGILEVLERDAYSISHKANIPGENLKISSINDKKVIALVNKLKEKGVKLHVKVLNSFSFYYVVHVVAESKDYPKYTHGSSAGLDILTAITRAIYEAIQMRVSQLELKNYFSEFEDLENPMYEWGIGNKLYVKNFLTESSEIMVDIKNYPSLSSGCVKKDIDNIIFNLKKEGYSVYCANLSREDSPLKTIRIIIPGLQDIDNYNSRITMRLKRKLKGKKLNKLKMFS